MNLASYTMFLRTLIEGHSQYDQTLSNRERLEIGRQKLFDFDYPFFDEGLRKDFETHFIRKFYMREIGFETEGLFKFQLETWLNIHMPYFNQLLQSETLSFNPLENVSFNVTTSLSKKKDQTDNIDRTEDETENETGSKNQTSTSNQTTHDADSLTDTKTTNRTETGSVDTDRTDDNTQTITGSSTLNSETDSTSNNDKTSNMNRQSDGTSNTDTDQTSTTNSDTTQNNFNRLIKSDTPDERLALTTQNGSGIIEYASSIEENKTTDTTTQNQTVTSSGSNDTVDSKTDVETGRSTDDTIANEITDQSTTNSQSQIGNTVGNEKTDATSTTSETVTNTIAKEHDGTNNVTKTDAETNANDLIKNRVGNQKLASVIETIETYSKEEKGKTGSDTYSKMLLEYRSTFMRIEKQIFDEMTELFMLVY